MKRISFAVPRSVAYSADVNFELYGDLGADRIDWTRPLPPGRVRLWPEAAARPGHLLEGHLIQRHLDSVDADGHLEGIHLWDEHLRPVLAVVVESPRYVFGRFRHAVRMFDAAGNTSYDEPVTFTHIINDSPPAPHSLRRIAWDAGGPRLRFAFEPVRFTPVRGS